MDIEYEYKRASIFYKKEVMVHASTNEFFVNGFIIEVSEDFVIIKDRKDGTEKLIFFSELQKSLEPTTTRGEEWKDGAE